MKVAERLDRDVMQALQQELHLVNPFIRRFEAITLGTCNHIWILRYAQT